MKFPIILLTSTCFVSDSATSPAADTAPCKFCDGGTVRGDTEIPHEDGTTCKGTLEYTAMVAATSDSCVAAKYAEALCCPSAASTCSICKGADLREDVIVPGLVGASCAEVAYILADYEMTSADCTTYQDLEAFCCPDPDIHSTTCYLCGEDGFGSINDDVQIPGEADGWTCGDEALWALSKDVNSEECRNLQSNGVEEICCSSFTSESSSAFPTRCVGNTAVLLNTLYLFLRLSKSATNISLSGTFYFIINLPLYVI